MPGGKIFDPISPGIGFTSSCNSPHIQSISILWRGSRPHPVLLDCCRADGAVMVLAVPGGQELQTEVPGDYVSAFTYYLVFDREHAA